MAEAAAEADRGRDNNSSSNKQTHWLVPRFCLSILRMTISTFARKCCDVLATVWRKVIQPTCSRVRQFPPLFFGILAFFQTRWTPNPRRVRRTFGAVFNVPVHAKVASAQPLRLRLMRLADFIGCTSRLEAERPKHEPEQPENDLERVDDRDDDIRGEPPYEDGSGADDPVSYTHLRAHET